MITTAKLIRESDKLFVEVRAGYDFVDKILLADAKGDSAKEELIIRLMIDWYTWGEFKTLWGESPLK